MGVVSFKELARKNEYELRSQRKLTREFVVVLSDDTLTGNPTAEPAVFAAIGIDIGSVHPTYTDAPYRCRKIVMTEGYEGSPYHVHIQCEYGVIYAHELVSPIARPYVWDFDSSPGEIPAFAYYHGSANNDIRPLTNSAYDFSPGLVTQEGIVTAKVTGNFASLPTSWIGVQNFVNDQTYLGCPPHSVKVAKVSVKQAQEEFNGSVVAFWQAVAELHYRQTGHNLQLPDVGWNFIAGNQKRRAMVFDFENGEWVASPNPVGLDGSGGLTFGAPAILNRRMNPVVNFSTLFGAPPTTPLPT